MIESNTREDIDYTRRRMLIRIGALSTGAILGFSSGLPLGHFHPHQIICVSHPVSTYQPIYLIELDSGTTQWRSLPSYLATPTPGGEPCSRLLKK